MVQRDGAETPKLVEKRFNMLAQFQDVKAADDGHVYVEGYASTFGNMDLDGEIVDPEAFSETLEEYKMNPIVLADHSNTVRSVVGQVVDAKVDHTGLWVRVKLSNAQDEFTSMVRQKVQEGILRAFSIGGLFQYEYPVIKRVKLLEISIVPIPANSYALFSMAKAWKSLDIEERKEGDPDPVRLDADGGQPEDSGHTGLEEPSMAANGDPATVEPKEPTIEDHFKTLVDIYTERGAYHG